MRVAVRQCPIDRRPLPQRAATAAARPLKRYLSEQAARPHGIGGRLIGRLWITETAAVNDAAIELLAPSRSEHILEIGFGPGRALGVITSRGATATGIDVSEAMVTMAGKRNRDLIPDRGPNALRQRRRVHSPGRRLSRGRHVRAPSRIDM